MANLTKSILAIFTFAFAANISAQTQTAIVGELSQLKFNISNAINTNKCHIEVTLPNQQKVGVEVDGPQFLASVEFTPQQIGNNVIQWEGKNKLRGLKSVFACPGSGVIQVQVNGNTEQIAQKWNQYFSAVNEEIRDCVKIGMDLSQLKYQVLADPAVTLTSPQDSKLKPIYEKCEIFAKQNQPRKGVPCTLPSQNNLKTICDGVYAERQPDGRLKTISRTAAIQMQFEGKPWTVGVLENVDVRVERLKKEEHDKIRQVEELAAKKDAEEKERLFKLSAEYKKQQSDLGRKRIAEENDASRKRLELEQIKVAEEKKASALRAKEEQDRESRAQKEKTALASQKAQEEKSRQQNNLAANPDRHEMGRIVSECWYYWRQIQILMIKGNKASPQQLDNIREKVELAGDISFKLIGKEMALFHHGNTSNLYIVQRKMGEDISPEITRETKKCNEFLDTPKTANAIKQMLLSGSR